MSSAVEQIRIEDIPVDDIDFSDLEKEYQVDEKFSFEHYIVVNGAPVIPEGKVAILKKALTNLFSKAGKVVEMEFPINEATGKTKGFLFVECATPADGTKIIKAFHTKRLDLKHRLYIYTMREVERYNSDSFNTEFEEPPMPEFVPTSSLNSWLEDEAGRDQYVLQNEDLTTIFWNSQFEEEDSVVESRENWSSNYVRFSPKGTFVFSYHDQGVVMWGGPNFSRLRRFYHPNVRTSSVSPNEKFLVTYSADPIVVDEEDPDSPFSIKNEGHQLCIWDVTSGLLKTTFPVVKSQFLQWPLVRWSFNDQYCARMVGDTLIVHDVSKGFAPIENKSLKVPGIRDFSFAPAGVNVAPFRANDEPSVLLAYWTPETNNMSCKATVVEVPRGRVLKTVNLVQVSNVTLHWQKEAEYLCFNVERHTKSKKTQFSNLEICKLTEKDIPVEKIELKECVVGFEWEPNGNRFAIIFVRENNDDNNAIPKNVASFYAPEKKELGDKSIGVKKWIEVASLADRFSNTISWSPAGRYVVIATLVKPNGRRSDFEFFDMDFNGEKNLNSTEDAMASVKDVAKSNFGSATDMSWDPSGRYVVVWSSALKHKADNGYKIFNIAGTIVKEEPVPNFKNFAWRPRPASLLSNGEKKKIRKNLREWSAQFAEQDAMEADAATRDLILRQREMLKEWTNYRAEMNILLETTYNTKSFDILPQDNAEDDFITVEELKEEILEESEEKVEE